MTNRTFKVRVNDKTSTSANLLNGIPQGSPLSVVLFIIAFDHVNLRLARYKKINLSLYADDIIILTKEKNLRTVKNTFLKILQDLESWGISSGASLSIEKCHTLHICRKVHCCFPTLEFRNKTIQTVTNLKILGIIFDSRFSFKEHCITLRKQLEVRANIIKFLSSKFSHIHPNILTNITRALILSKIEYGLPIYGAATHLRKLQSPYNTSVRRSINAFPTSPIRCILAEAGLPTIMERLNEVTMNLIPKLFTSPNHSLVKDFKACFRKTRTPRVPSTLHRCAKQAAQIGLAAPKRRIIVSSTPPWKVTSHYIKKDLHFFAKNDTPSRVFQAQFGLLRSQLGARNWLYTDGSKTDSSSTFAVVNEDNDIIAAGTLPNFNSIFTIEAFAVLQACQYANKNKGKFAICTDSLSTISALENPGQSDPTICQIRKIICFKAPKITIIWVPSHQGILGNEQADAAARFMSTAPTLLFTPTSAKDIFRLITSTNKEKLKSDWEGIIHRYNTLNPAREKTTFPTDLNKHDRRIYTRLRIGHTQETHEHLLQGLAPPPCRFCGGIISSIEHLLDTCQALNHTRFSIFGSVTVPSSLLTSPSIPNIKKLKEYITTVHLRI